jgi:hypothetical protein
MVPTIRTMSHSAGLSRFVSRCLAPFTNGIKSIPNVTVQANRLSWERRRCGGGFCQRSRPSLVEPIPPLSAWFMPRHQGHSVDGRVVWAHQVVSPSCLTGRSRPLLEEPYQSLSCAVRCQVPGPCRIPDRGPLHAAVRVLLIAIAGLHEAYRGADDQLAAAGLLMRAESERCRNRSSSYSLRLRFRRSRSDHCPAVVQRLPQKRRKRRERRQVDMPIGRHTRTQPAGRTSRPTPPANDLHPSRSGYCAILCRPTC